MYIYEFEVPNGPTKLVNHKCILKCKDLPKKINRNSHFKE